MTWTKSRKRLYAWREFLTEAETARVRLLETRNRQTAAQKLELIRIRNRAIQRARYEAKKR